MRFRPLVFLGVLALGACLLLPASALAQVVAVYRGEAKRASGEAPSKAIIAFTSLDPGVLNGNAGLEVFGEQGSFVGRLDGRALALVSRTPKHHLAWTGKLDPATGKLAGAIRAIPLDGSAVEVWTYELTPSEAADGLVTTLKVSDIKPEVDDTKTTSLLDLARLQPAPTPALPPPPLVGEWEIFTYIDDYPQTRPFYIESVSGTLFVYRLGSLNSPSETGTYDPAAQRLHFVSEGYTHEGRLELDRRGNWQIKGPMRRGTGDVAEATDSRGTLKATRKGDLPKP